MIEEINLAGSAAGIKKKTNPFVIFSVLLVAIVVGVSGLLFGYNLYLKTSLSGLIAQEETQVQQLTRLAPQKTRVMTIQERLSSIQKILSGRQEIASRFDAISATIPNGVDVSDIATGKDSITIKLISGNLSALNAFLEERLGTIIQEKSIGVKKINVDGFVLQRANSNYSTLITFEF